MERPIEVTTGPFTGTFIVTVGERHIIVTLDEAATLYGLLGNEILSEAMTDRDHADLDLEADDDERPWTEVPMAPEEFFDDGVRMLREGYGG